MQNITAALNVPEVPLDLPVAVLLAKKDPTIHSVEATLSVHRAISIMSEQQIGCVMVVENDRLVGLLSERDYTRKVILMGRSSLGTRAKEIMTEPVVTIAPETTVSESMRLIDQHRVRHLPVLDGERLVGVISIGDLINHVLTAQQQTIVQLQETIAAQTVQ